MVIFIFAKTLKHISIVTVELSKRNYSLFMSKEEKAEAKEGLTTTADYTHQSIKRVTLGLPLYLFIKIIFSCDRINF